MKRILLFAAIIISGSLFAQNDFHEDFETADGQHPYNWSSTGTGYGKFSVTTGVTKAEYYDAFHDASEHDGSATLYLPELHVAFGNSVLNYFVRYNIVTDLFGIQHDDQLFIEISTDGGSTWIGDGINIIAYPSGQNDHWYSFTESTDFTNFNGTSYMNQDILIRFKAFSHYGSSHYISLDDFNGLEYAGTGYVADLETTSNPSMLYTFFPVSQATPIFPGAIVTNNNYPLLDATNMDFEVRSGLTTLFSQSVAITTPMNNAVTEVINGNSSFNPVGGTYTIISNANYASDPNPSDNESVFNYTVTSGRLSYSLEQNEGDLSASAFGIAGNKFVFNGNDILRSVTFHITGGSAYSCKGKVYDFTGNTIGSLIGETGTINISSSDNTYTEDFTSPINVTEGQEVLVVIDNLGASSGLHIGLDSRKIEDIAWVSNGDFVSTSSLGMDNVFELDIFVDDSNSEADTTTYYVSSPEFEAISPKVYMEFVEEVGGVTITHYTKYVYSSCNETPVPTINTNAIKIYPNPAKNHIYISNDNYDSMSEYSIRINNTLGQTVYTGAIDQKEVYIDLSDWTGSGVYFVHIIDESSNIVTTKRVVIQ